MRTYPGGNQDVGEAGGGGLTDAPFQIFDEKPVVADVRSEVIAGLSVPCKFISPKFFYNQAGSKLFETITRLPEYYLTRTELGILDAHGADLARMIDGSSALVEYGAGSSLKIRCLLEQVNPGAPGAYVPVDISADHLLDMARGLRRDFPYLPLYPTCADFTGEFPLPPTVRDMDLTGFFPGSSIGNFSPEEAEALLSRIRAALGDGGRLIIGVDLKKDRRLLEAAYNDTAGVTARFNLNLLTHLGSVLDADLDPARFAHRAEFNPVLGAIQMFLDVRETHEVQIGGALITFQAGEAVHTENSFKYHPEEFLALAAAAGFRHGTTWTDPRQWFAIFILSAA